MYPILKTNHKNLHPQKKQQLCGSQYRRLIDYLLFYIPLKNFSLALPVKSYPWRAAKFGLMLSAQTLNEQKGIFIVPHLLWHGASVFPNSSKGPPHSVAFYNTQGDVEDLF
jgi:hypothetical protein